MIDKETNRGSQRRRMAALLLLGIAVLAAAPRRLPAGEGERFTFPTTANDAMFNFTSFPDLFNWNIKYPQPGWEEAMDWFLAGMKKEGPAFSLNAGDIMDARWWTDKQEVRRKTREYWGGFRKRFADKDIRLYIAPGDHEYGDDQGLRKMHLAPVFAAQFVDIFAMPDNGPDHKKGLAYCFARENLAVISVDTFENTGKRMSMTVSGPQLAWLKEKLREYRDTEFIIVQGHVPVVGPVKSRNSSANMLEGGPKSGFWKAMVAGGVDVYLCGEHHRITAKKHDGIWQIVHGALWGTQADVNYLRGSVWPGKLVLELFEFDVIYGGGYLGDHPHRGAKNRPRETVAVSREALTGGPRSVGKLVIEHGPDGNRTTLATGAFGRFPQSHPALKGFTLQPREGWRVVTADSASRFNRRLPKHVIDGDPATHWSTEWKDNRPDHPHHVVVDRGASRPIGGFVYVPRQDGNTNGVVTAWAFYAGDDPEEFGSPVARGRFAGNRDPKPVRFDAPARGRYVKFESRAAMRGEPWATMAELYTVAP